jgi:hypothetical protein
MSSIEKSKCIEINIKNYLEKNIKERAYYMYLNGEYSSDEERYSKATEIELDIKKRHELKYEYENRLKYYNDILTEDQIEALKLVHETCYSRHQKVLKTYETIHKDEANDIVKLTKNKLENTEICINVPLSHVNNIANDTHYRNQFETKVSSGTLSNTYRKAWEYKLFQYNDNVKDFDRPKYGNLPIEVSSSHSFKHVHNYGICFFVLKNHVRDRTTITLGDSYRCNINNVFNFDYFHLIGEPSISYLKYFIDTGKVTNDYIYIEIQIHGPIRLDTDIEKFCYPIKYHNDLKNCIIKLESKGIICSSF